MSELKGFLNVDALLEANPAQIAESGSMILDSEMLVADLENSGPFAPSRKRFCEFLGIGESTLSGWLSANRIPKMAKVAYVLLIALDTLRTEVKQLRDDAQAPKIVKDRDRYHLVRFGPDESGQPVGSIIARDLPDGQTARVLASSYQTFRLLEEARDVIAESRERTELPGRYIDHLEDLDNRISDLWLRTFEPEQWLKQKESESEESAKIDEFLKDIDASEESKPDSSSKSEFE